MHASSMRGGDHGFLFGSFEIEFSAQARRKLPVPFQRASLAFPWAEPMRAADGLIKKGVARDQIRL